MPAITLNSLQFPGLSDTYKIPPQANEFSSTETYSEGTYVTYQGQLYKCIVEVTTAGDWTGSTNWTQINIGDAVENLTNDLSGKAPAGFGLGVQLNTLTAIQDANDISQTGWFCTVSTTSNLPSNRDTSYAGVIESVVRGTTYMYQKYYDYHAAKIFDRVKNEGGWGQWIQVYPDTSRVPAYGMGKNLLDNWYFLNPVNQRGQSSYSTDEAYTIDRFRLGGAIGTAQFDSGGVLLSNLTLLSQYVDIKRISSGEKYTISVLWSNGLITATGTLTKSSGTTSWQISTDTYPAARMCAIRQLTSNAFQFICEGDGTNKAIAVKLELGAEQTLCHNEGTDANPVWVLNEIPEYEEELIKCQTSTADSNDTFANKTLATEQQLAVVETGSTASRAYAVGEYFCWNGLLYRAKTTISSGASFTVGTNCEQTTVTSMPGYLLLWTNSNTANNFAAQDIPGTGGFRLYLVVCRIMTSSQGYVSYWLNCDSGEMQNITFVSSPASTVPYISFRQVTKQQSGLLNISNCDTRAITATSRSQDNSQLIPYKIFGIY